MTAAGWILLLSCLLWTLISSTTAFLLSSPRDFSLRRFAYLKPPQQQEQNLRKYLQSSQALIVLPTSALSDEDVRDLLDFFPRDKVCTLPSSVLVNLVDQTPFCMIAAYASNENRCIFIENRLPEKLVEFKAFVKGYWLKAMSKSEEDQEAARAGGPRYAVISMKEQLLQFDLSQPPVYLLSEKMKQQEQEQQQQQQQEQKGMEAEVAGKKEEGAA